MFFLRTWHIIGKTYWRATSWHPFNVVVFKIAGEIVVERSRLVGLWSSPMVNIKYNRCFSKLGAPKSIQKWSISKYGSFGSQIRRHPHPHPPPHHPHHHRLPASWRCSRCPKHHPSEGWKYPTISSTRVMSDIQNLHPQKPKMEVEKKDFQISESLLYKQDKLMNCSVLETWLRSISHLWSRLPWGSGKPHHAVISPWGRGVFYGLFHKINTPPKTNMEPENGPLEKEIPIGNHHFQVPC